MSDCVSTHAPLHCATGQVPVTHALFVQICPAPHIMLQPPQWFALLAGSTHTPTAQST
jgi:hypothetical protein